MGARFRVTDRRQPMLFPPSLDELIPEDDLARIVVDAVDQLDLSAIEASCNPEGDGRSAIDPAAMLATLIYAYALKVLSSRQIEILCRNRACRLTPNGQKASRGCLYPRSVRGCPHPHPMVSGWALSVVPGWG